MQCYEVKRELAPRQQVRRGQLGTIPLTHTISAVSYQKNPPGKKRTITNTKFSDSSVSSISSHAKTQVESPTHKRASGIDVREDMRPGGTTHVLAACKLLGWLNSSI